MLAYLWLFRWLMIFMFRSQLGSDNRWLSFIRCSVTGFRFDVSVATYWILLPLFASVVCAFTGSTRLAERIRLTTGVLFLSLTSLLSMATVGFFREYHDQFNHWIFGVIFDDRRAIFQTICREHHVLLDLAGLGFGVTAGSLLLKRILKLPSRQPKTARVTLPGRWAKLLIVVILPAMVIIGARGSIGRRPLQLHDVAVTQDDFLNKLIPNSYYALKFAIRSHILLSRTQGLKTILPDEDVRSAAHVAFPHSTNYGDVDACLVKHARGFSGTRPRHIFLVVMESYDSWPMLPEYRCLGLTRQLEDLARNGISVKAFVSAGDGTMPSLGAIITGLPDVGVMVNYQRSSRTPFPCSAAPIFKRLGYTTRFFYGGYLSWLRIGDFCREQGFDQVYGGGHVVKGDLGHEWGVPDADLFHLIETTVSDGEPSFNLIMSTSYHPPYSLDVYGMGFSLREMPPGLKSRSDNTADFNIFGHLWYADRSLRDFVRVMEQKLGAPLFAMTGDHPSRRFINSRPDLYERSAVPCVLYGKEALAGIVPPHAMAGAHVDLVPTLVELCAPAGFEYSSFGGSLLDPLRSPIGFGARTIVGPDFIIEVDHSDQVHTLPGSQSTPSSIPSAALKQLYQANQGLAWWRAMRGSVLPAPP